jgi:hypothetical protein
MGLPFQKEYMMQYTMDDPLDADMQKCVQDCTDCNNASTRTIAYCMTMGGKHAEAAHLKSLLDSAEACAASVHFMLRGSPLHHQMLALCAAACEQCAQSCEQFPDDEQMRFCAETCRRCAESCREMARVKA